MAQLARLALVCLAVAIYFGKNNAGTHSAERALSLFERDATRPAGLKLERLVATPYTLADGQQALIVNGEVSYAKEGGLILPPLSVVLMSRDGGVRQRVAFGQQLTSSQLCHTQDVQQLLAQLAHQAERPRPRVFSGSKTPFAALFVPFERSQTKRWLVADWDVGSKTD